MKKSQQSNADNQKSVALIVTTYNQPDALNAVVSSIKQQTHLPARVVIADDGSNHHTTALIKQIAHVENEFIIQHVWQPDSAFRAARSRNLAVSKASENYIIFIDGDCLLPPKFIENHIKLSSRKLLVAGARLLLEPEATAEILRNGFNPNSKTIFASYKFTTLPLGPLRLLFRRNWERARTCNLAIHMKDFLSVDGFDESYVGWGKEDNDLALRLVNAGVKIKDARYACCVAHLHHITEQKDRLIINNEKIKNVLRKSAISHATKSSIGFK